nr:MAG TPA: hypothetical protein [Caudoviricetes sp.]
MGKCSRGILKQQGRRFQMRTRRNLQSRRCRSFYS